MAFTEQQKHDIIRVLGWPGKTLIETSTHYNSTVVSRLTNLNTIIEKQAVGLYTRIASIQEQMDTARCRLKATSVQDIELNPDELLFLKKEYTRTLRELSDLLDIAIIKTGGINVGVVA